MEPLLEISDDKYCLFPLKRPDLYKKYEDAFACFWSHTEADLTQDVLDFERITDGERHYIKHILSFFANMDSLVNENIILNFLTKITDPSCQLFYGWQLAIENIHNITYSTLIETLIKDKDEQRHLFRAIETIDAVKHKCDWVKKWISNGTFQEQIIAQACIEMIAFSGAFCAIYYFKKRGLFPGLVFLNSLIARDEGLHSEFAIALHNNHIVNKVSNERITEIVREMTLIEHEFVRDALPVSLLGLNESSHCQYVSFCADYLLTRLGCPKLYNVQNPYDWMHMISMQSKVNFFEGRNDSYSLSKGFSGNDGKFNTDSDF